MKAIGIFLLLMIIGGVFSVILEGMDDDESN